MQGSGLPLSCRLLQLKPVTNQRARASKGGVGGGGIYIMGQPVPRRSPGAHQWSLHTRSGAKMRSQAQRRALLRTGEVQKAMSVKQEGAAGIKPQTLNLKPKPLTETV